MTTQQNYVCNLKSVSKSIHQIFWASLVKPKIDVVAVVYNCYSNSGCDDFFYACYIMISCLIKGTVVTYFKTIPDVFSNPNQVVLLP